MIIPVTNSDVDLQKTKIKGSFIGGMKNQAGGCRSSILMADNKAPIFKKLNHMTLEGTSKLKAAKGLHVFESKGIINQSIYKRFGSLVSYKKDQPEVKSRLQTIEPINHAPQKKMNYLKNTQSLTSLPGGESLHHTSQSQLHQESLFSSNS